MDRLSTTDLIDAGWKLRAAWRRLHPERGDDEMPTAIRNAEPASLLSSLLTGLRDLVTTHQLAEPEPAAPGAPASEPVEGSTPASIDLSQFAAKDRGQARLFVDLRRFSEAPDWINILPKPGIFLHEWYGDIIITAERNARFVQNFADRVYGQDLPVDAEHETKLSGAFGWIVEMRVNDEGGVEAKVNWTERGKQAFEQDAFRYVSPEWFDWWQQPMTGQVYEDVLIGLALTNHPFFKESALLPLLASEDGRLSAPEGGTRERPFPASERGSAVTIVFTPLAAREHGPVPAAVREQRKKVASMTEKPETPDPAKPTTAAETVTLTAEQAQQFSELQRQHTDLTAKFSEQAAEITQLREANAKAQRDAMVKRFTDEVRGRSEANPNAWVGEIDKNVALVTSMAEKLGEDSEEFQFFVANQRAIAAQAKDSALFSAVGGARGGEGDGSALNELNALTETYRKEHNVTAAQAMEKVLSQNPGLYDRYQAELRG